jgi:hypothetical protein
VCEVSTGSRGTGSRTYEECERRRTRDVHRLVVLSRPDEYVRRLSLRSTPPFSVFTSSVHTCTCATHSDSTAAWILAKCARASVAETKSVPDGQPSNGGSGAGLINWHARYSGESAAVDPRSAASSAARNARG